MQEQVQQLQASLSQGAQAREAATAALQAQVQEQVQMRGAVAPWAVCSLELREPEVEVSARVICVTHLLRA